MPRGLLGLLAGAACLLVACTQNPCPLPVRPGLGAVVIGQVVGAQDAPVEAAWVVPADATGAPIPGMMRARTDAAGRFWAGQVPPGFAYVLQARLPDSGQPVYSGLAQPALEAEHSWELSPATTVVTVLALQGRVGMPGLFDRGVYTQTVDAVKVWLKQRPQPDIADQGSLRAWMDERQREDPALQARMRQLMTETARAGSREQVEAALALPHVGPLDALKPIY